MSDATTRPAPRPRPLLEVEDLRVGFLTEDGHAARRSTASRSSWRAGEVLAIVGESGSRQERHLADDDGPDPLAERAHRGLGHATRARSSSTRATRTCSSVRGEELAMIFQDPMTSLNPVYRVGKQIVEAIQRPRATSSKDEALRRAIELLGSGRDPRPAAARRRVPARVLGRDAPAGDDRDGAGAGAERADRRRADHRARRDDPGADPAAAEAAQPRARPGGRS